MHYLEGVKPVDKIESSNPLQNPFSASFNNGNLGDGLEKISKKLIVEVILCFHLSFFLFKNYLICSKDIY